MSMYLSNDDANEPGAEVAEFIEADPMDDDEDDGPVDPRRRPSGSLPLPPGASDDDSHSSAG
jgi:hypothetical protein